MHIKALLRKMHVQNRTQAAVWAVNNSKAAETRPSEQPSGLAGKQGLIELPNTAAILVGSPSASTREKSDRVLPSRLNGSAKDISGLNG